jgi:choline kinase|tara:strand:+ start:408 stop:1103 length:696 start_codon:yes stop_codon:yes gene_type:complete
MNSSQKKNNRIIFCLPGNNFSNHFLLAWSDLILWCQRNNIDFIVSNQYSSVVHFARSLCLGGDNTRGEKQLPFNGKEEYDYIMWIDSDIVFKVEDFKKLLEAELDIVSGIYKMEDTIHYPIIEKYDIDYFKQNGKLNFLNDNGITEIKEAGKLLKKKYLNVEYNGMGFMLIKKNVIEQLKYPWFYHEVYKNENIVEMFGEDVSFCRNLKKAGFDIYVDLDVRVGRYKSFII